MNEQYVHVFSTIIIIKPVKIPQTKELLSDASSLLHNFQVNFCKVFKTGLKPFCN